MFCSNCGKVIADRAAICLHCGAATGNPSGGTWYVPKSKVAALVLCIFLGELGIHRFYVGKIGTGILWLCTLGLCGVGWVFDIIFILTGAFKDKAGQPLR